MGAGSTLPRADGAEQLLDMRDRRVLADPMSEVEDVRSIGKGVQHRARLTYAAYVGFLQLNLQLHQARMQQDEFDAYVEHLAQTLVPA